MPSIITRCERMFRLGRMRPAHARSSGSERLLRIRSLAGYIIGTLESRFRKRQANGGSIRQFKHPTIGDAYAELLVQSPELLGIYIRGSAPERIVDQVTCGDVGVEKAGVVPKSLFAGM